MNRTTPVSEPPTKGTAMTLLDQTLEDTRATAAAADSAATVTFAVLVGIV